MATDIKKFLDQAGVSTLWSRVAEEVAKVDAKAVKNAEDIAAHAGKIQTMEGQIAALEAGTYDDSEVRGLIAGNKAAHEANAAAIATLNGAADVAGSVANTANAAAAAKVAEIVANADANFDTLKEIADWILNDTTGAADMANDIAALQGLVGDKAVAEQIADAISAEGLDKYALAADLTTLANRVKALEDAGYQNAEAVAAAIDAKITALDLANAYDAKGAAAAAETAAKAHADSLNTAMNARVVVLEAIDHSKFEAAGAAAQALVDAKAYTDAEIAGHVTALSTAEIDAAIASAKAQA
jgi:ribosome-binding protein aMBF1 (putative translation factor)